MVLLLMALFVVAGLTLTGCNADAPDRPNDASGSTVPGSLPGTLPDTVTDDLDRTVRLRRPVERIIPLAPNLTELAFAAGAGSRVVAVGPSDDVPSAVDSLPHVSVLPVDFEAVVAQEPDLVLATTQVNATRDADTFDAMDIPVYFFSFPTVESVFDGIRRVGELAGTPDTAADSADALADAFQEIRSRTARRLDQPSDRPRVLVLAGSDVLYSFGRDSYVHTLVDAAGGVSVTADLDASAPTLSEEFVLSARPEVIIGAFNTDDPAASLLEHHPAFDILPAVQNTRVHSLPGDLLFRPGPRIVQGTQRLAQILHPDVLRPAVLQSSRPPK